MQWNPETSQVTLPPTSNVTTPPPLFDPTPTQSGVCANSAKPGDLISVVRPNDNQIVFCFVGDVRVCVESDVRSAQPNSGGGVSLSDVYWYPETMDTPTISDTTYSAAALTLPIPSDVLRSSLTGDSFSFGRNEYGAGDLACSVAIKTVYAGLPLRKCAHQDNSTQAYQQWLAYESPYALTTATHRTILNTYIVTLQNFQTSPTEEPNPPILPALALFTLLFFGAAGAAAAGVATSSKTRRQHGSI